ncbi:MAG: hypothetical protein M1834_006120 [Cirrosporium novae-zelandiae]|nr:MAG: hypothetical protein M1834_006120 [Cirrosporium novae-zelandiae]
MALLALYLRLSSGLRGLFYKLTIGTVIFITCFSVATIITASLQCRPISYYWTGSGDGTCINITAFFYAMGIFTIVTDLWIFALPIPTLWKINRPTKEKLFLIAVFLAGAISTVASCIRLYTIKLAESPNHRLYNLAPINMWSFIELNLGIVCVSGPSIKALFAPYHPSKSNATPIFYSGTPSNAVNKSNSNNPTNRSGNRSHNHVKIQTGNHTHIHASPYSANKAFEDEMNGLYGPENYGLVRVEVNHESPDSHNINRQDDHGSDSGRSIAGIEGRNGSQDEILRADGVRVTNDVTVTSEYVKRTD